MLVGTLVHCTPTLPLATHPPTSTALPPWPQPPSSACPQTRHLPRFSASDTKILKQYLHSRLWLTGLGADLGGAVLQIAAFAMAPVSFFLMMGSCVHPSALRIGPVKQAGLLCGLQEALATRPLAAPLALHPMVNHSACCVCST